MGEAKRRREAFMEARPWVPPRVCPRCKSIRIVRNTLPGASGTPTDYDCCRDCGTAWEAYPSDWCEDVVGATPCDNCAFRPGSPEQADPKEWKKLIMLLKSGQEFRCHKGAPIIGLDKDPPEIEFDAEWIGRRGRRCAGFMQIVWAMRDKGESWLTRYIERMSHGSAEGQEGAAK